MMWHETIYCITTRVLHSVLVGTLHSSNENDTRDLSEQCRFFDLQISEVLCF